MSYILKGSLDELVRDLTSVYPKPKSEVRRRILELTQKEKQALAREITEGIKEILLCNHHIYKRNKNYNEVVNDINTLIKRVAKKHNINLE